MTNEEIIAQLQDIKCHCREMYEAEIKNGDTSSSIWGKDVKALDLAIKELEQTKTGHKLASGRCSICGAKYNGIYKAYCPNCGARMMPRKETDDVKEIQ